MREMSAWSVAASLFFSIALMSSAQEAYTNLQLAGAGNPAAVERSLSGFVARMGGDAKMIPAVAGDATGKVVEARLKSNEAARLQREQDWVLSKGKDSGLALDLSGIFGLTDGTTKYPVRIKGWQDDDDKTIHYFSVGTAADRPIIITFKPADTSYAVNWLTDVNGRIVRTTYTDASGTRIVGNDEYAALLQTQFTFWDAKVPAGS